MSNVTVTLDGAAAVIAAAQLRDDALRVRSRDALWSRKLGEVAAALERELYTTADTECRCRNPVCEKVHPVDMGVVA